MSLNGEVKFKTICFLSVWLDYIFCHLWLYSKLVVLVIGIFLWQKGTHIKKVKLADEFECFWVNNAMKICTHPVNNGNPFWKMVCIKWCAELMAE